MSALLRPPAGRERERLYLTLANLCALHREMSEAYEAEMADVDAGKVETGEAKMAWQADTERRIALLTNDLRRERKWVQS